MAIEIRKASRAKAWVKTALTGVTGAGKTYSGLLIANGLGERPIMIDTENGSGELYSHLFPYDYIRLSPPFTPAKYVEAIEAAVRNGNDVVIIDSLSHAWKYVLDYKDTLDASNPKAGFQNWRKAKKLMDETMTALLQAPIHVVACMREKQEWVQEGDGKGGNRIVKQGTQPIAEPDLEFEFTVCWKIERSHQALTSKDRTEIWDLAAPFTITEKTGVQLREWMSQGTGQLNQRSDWQAGMNADEEAQSALKEASRLKIGENSNPGTLPLTHRDIIAKWQISEQDWAGFRGLCKQHGVTASEYLLDAFGIGDKDLQEVCSRLQGRPARDAFSDEEPEGSGEGSPKDATPEGAAVPEGSESQSSATSSAEPSTEGDTSAKGSPTSLQAGEPVASAESSPTSSPTNNAQSADGSTASASASNGSAKKPEEDKSTRPTPDDKEAFDYRPERWPLAPQFLKKATEAQSRLAIDKLEARSVPAAGLGKMRDGLWAAYGMPQAQSDSQASYSVLIDFLVSAPDEPVARLIEACREAKTEAPTQEALIG